MLARLALIHRMHVIFFYLKIVVAQFIAPGLQTKKTSAINCATTALHATQSVQRSQLESDERDAWAWYKFNIRDLRRIAAPVHITGDHMTVAQYLFHSSDMP